MKKIIILMRNGQKDRCAAKFISDNLNEVLENTVTIQIMYLDEIKTSHLLEADIILVPVYNMLYEIKDYFHGEWDNILLATRTLSKDAWNHIKEIPAKENVLVVNKTKETTLDMLRLLYQLGIMHLNFVPYQDGYSYQDFRYVVTTAYDINLSLPASTKVIDVGYRKLDTQVFLNIFSKLKIESDRITRNLIQYMQKLPQKDTDVERRYLSSKLLNKTLIKVIDKSESGIIVVDNDKRIVCHNQMANHILHTTFDFGDLFELPSTPDITEMLFQKNFLQELIQIAGEYIMVKRSQLMSMEEVIGYYFDFHTAKSINEMGSKLSSKLHKSGLYARYTFHDIIYKSENMERCLTVAKSISNTKYPVIIYGETGSGKELLAQSIHNFSDRREEPFVAVNCAALPEQLLESELFGYEGGAFTGSKREGKLGLFEAANNGTIFLDEIGDMPLSLQSKLLRVLQEQQIMRVGSNEIIDINVRILSATNKDLMKEIAKNKFRDDLYYRLAVFTVTLPALRDRKEDILPLFYLFFNLKQNKLTDSEKQQLISYNWPGNVRELQNAATYYRMIGNLQCISHPAQKSIITQTAQAETEMLKILSAYSDIGLGRGNIIKMLHQKGVEISEKRFESIVQKLLKDGLITRSRGRGGIKLTDIGKSQVTEQ